MLFKKPDKNTVLNLFNIVKVNFSLRTREKHTGKWRYRSAFSPDNKPITQ